MAKSGPEPMAEKTVFDKGEAAIDLSDSIADKWISHNAPPYAAPYSNIEPGAIESFFARFLYPIDIGIIFTSNASLFARSFPTGQM